MRIHLYTRSWNDAVMLPFFFRHYDPIVDRYIVFDDGSTDDSIRLLQSHPKVDLRRLPPYVDPDSRVISASTFFDTCWKESSGHADWVIVTDVDEHLYHPRLTRYLSDCLERGVTMIPSLGYQMVADALPVGDQLLCRTLTMGAPWYVMSKPSVFSPNAITVTNFGIGRHSAAMAGDVRLPHRDELLLLHYKYVDFEYLTERHMRALARQRSTDLRNNWGIQYSWSREELRESWNWFSSRAVDVSRPHLRPWATHLEHRWWDHYPRVLRSPLDRALRAMRDGLWQRRRSKTPPDSHPLHLSFKQ